MNLLKNLYQSNTDLINCLNWKALIFFIKIFKVLTVPLHYIKLFYFFLRQFLKMNEFIMRVYLLLRMNKYSFWFDLRNIIIWIIHCYFLSFALYIIQSFNFLLKHLGVSRHFHHKIFFSLFNINAFIDASKLTFVNLLDNQILTIYNFTNHGVFNFLYFFNSIVYLAVSSFAFYEGRWTSFGELTSIYLTFTIQIIQLCF